MADLRGMPADLSRFYPPPLTLAQLREGWPQLLAPAHLRDGLGASGEHPFIGSDEAPAPDPLVDFRRALELTGERWLSFSEAVALLREREPMSIGQAEAIIDDLRMAYFADGGPFARQSGKSTAVRWRQFHDNVFPMNEPNQGNTFVSMGDLIYWHDRSRAAPEPALSSAPKASRTQIRKIVAEYLRTAENPTMDGCWQFAQSKGVTGHQKTVRDEYSEQSGRPGSGRRRKNP